MSKKTKAKRSPKKVVKGIVLPHVCPSCHTKATTNDQDIKIFGQRNMRDAKGITTLRSQSYCRKCRSKHHVTMVNLKAKRKNLAKIDLRTNKGISLKSGKKHERKKANHKANRKSKR